MLSSESKDFPQNPSSCIRITTNIATWIQRFPLLATSTTVHPPFLLAPHRGPPSHSFCKNLLIFHTVLFLSPYVSKLPSGRSPLAESSTLHVSHSFVNGAKRGVLPFRSQFFCNTKSIMIPVILLGLFAAASAIELPGTFGYVSANSTYDVNYFYW